MPRPCRRFFARAVSLHMVAHVVAVREVLTRIVEGLEVFLAAALFAATPGISKALVACLADKRELLVWRRHFGP